ncbi:MAG TPA: GAF domain-containing protein [Solirubrobacterales bacterium]|jgi:GAF domain-containing protein
MTDSDVSFYQEVMDKLRSEVKTFRTVLRLEHPDEQFPVAAESLEDGAESAKGPMDYDLVQVETVQFQINEQRILVQNDTREAPHPPQEMLDVENVGAQMLSPIFVGDNVVGIVAVHHYGPARTWTGEEVSWIAWATDQVRRRKYLRGEA